MFCQLAMSATDSGFVPVRDKKILRERNQAIKKLVNVLINMGFDEEEVKPLCRIVKKK